MSNNIQHDTIGDSPNDNHTTQTVNNSVKLSNNDLFVELVERLEKIEQKVKSQEQSARRINKTFNQKMVEKEMEIQKSVIMKTISEIVEPIIGLFEEAFFFKANNIHRTYCGTTRGKHELKESQYKKK